MRKKMSILDLTRIESGNEQGFTIIELLWAMAILMVLAGMAVMAGFVYMEHAEYAKAEVALRNARVAIGQGELDAPAGYSLGFTFSSIGGGEISGPLASILPGYSVPDELRVGVLYNGCELYDPDVHGPTALIAYSVTSQPCNNTAMRYTTFVQYCGGFQLHQRNIDKDYSCS